MNEEKDLPGEEITLQEAFDMLWMKFVPFACDACEKMLTPEKAAFVSGRLRQPSNLALLVALDKLGKRGEDEDGWEKVENRRKIIRTRDELALCGMVADALDANSFEVDPEIMQRAWGFADMFVTLVDAINQ